MARVDGEPVDSPNFWKGVPLYSALSQTGQSGLPEAANGVVPVSEAAGYAMFLVQVHVLKTVNAKNGTTVGAAQIEQTRKSLLGSQQGSLFKGKPDWFVDQIVEAQANFEALIAFYAKDVDISTQVKQYYTANKDQFRQVCMDVIGGTDEAEIAAARKRLEEGTDFATVAKAVAASQPPGPDGAPATAMGAKADGDVGCVAVSTLGSLFADPSGLTQLTDAAPNALIGPVPVAGGAFMLFRVRSTSVQTLAEATPTIEQSLGQVGQQQAQQALNEYLKVADVELNPRLGSWTKGIGYQPPKGAERPAGETTIPAGLSGAVR